MYSDQRRIGDDAWLARLSPNIAARIAHGNARALFAAAE
jgi:hypothetical protein